MKIKDQIICAFAVPLVFPEGFSVGSSGKGNEIRIERNGQDLPVLRGSSIAGVIRSEMEKAIGTDKIEEYFGRPLENGMERQESSIVFFDMTFPDQTDITVHNMICRHTGSVSEADKGLFSVERVQAGAKAVLRCYFKGEKGEEEENRRFTEQLISIFRKGLFLGGNQARGIGRAVPDGDVFTMQVFHPEKTDELAAFLDVLYSDSWKLNEKIAFKEGELSGDCLKVEVTFGIPRGQDLLCAEGSDDIPAMSAGCDGKRRWKIPGSTIRGVLKGWISRLAAREGNVLADSAGNYDPAVPMKDIQKRDEVAKDPVLSLFGTLEKKGRIHIADALSQPVDPEEGMQFRMHVAIDSFSGGTNPGRLFHNYVLTDPDGKLHFPAVITIHDPVQKDADWLKRSLQAVQLGLLRFGSSKASGRLEIRAIQILEKPHDVQFDAELERN